MSKTDHDRAAFTDSAMFDKTFDEGMALVEETARYLDGKGRDSRRTIWPFALGFFDRVRVVVAWCEMREDFRHFRTDRISKVQVTDKRYPRRRQALLKDWRAAEGIPEK